MMDAAISNLNGNDVILTWSSSYGKENLGRTNFQGFS
jgi:hypothetical protein